MIMYLNYDFIRGRLLFWCVLLNLLDQSLQFPRGLQQEKKFNIEAVPVKDGKLMLHLKSRYGSSGIDGPMGDIGPPGLQGVPGLMGEQGVPGFCSVELCNAMQEARALVSRVEALENFVKQRSGLHLDVKPTTKPSDSTLVALHITSDILLTKGNSSSGKTAIPGNIKVNIALKNAAPLMESGQNSGKFFVNSTVQLLDRSKMNELKSGIARSPDGVSLTEQQFQSPRSNFPQQEVPSIKKSRIPVVKKVFKKKDEST